LGDRKDIWPVKNVFPYPQRFSFGTVEQEEPRSTGWWRFTWKAAIKWKFCEQLKAQIFADDRAAS